MKKTALSSLIAGMLLLFCALPAMAMEMPSLRLLLRSDVYELSVKVSTGTYQLVANHLPIADATGGDTLLVEKEGQTVQVTLNGQILGTYGLPFDLNAKDDSCIFALSALQYKGSLGFRNADTGLSVINTVDIEDYLLGVLGKEMGAGMPLEALKAQAVASRTYALCFVQPSASYDIGVTTASQAYGGYTAATSASGNKINQAVTQTRGELLYYIDAFGNQKVVPAYYHANSGGYTENIASVWSSTPNPCLVGTASPADAYALQTSAASSYEWQVTFTGEEIAAMMNAYLVKQGKSASFGTYEGMKLYRIGYDGKTLLSGRVTKLDIIGSGATVTFNKDSAIRGALNLKSSLFSLVAESGLSIRSLAGVAQTQDTSYLRATNASANTTTINNGAEQFYVVSKSGVSTINKTSISSGAGSDTIVLNGKGYGHGIGMSQWGAIGMANEGADYREILAHYYNGDVSFLEKAYE